ncbi:HV03 protein, partial [Locustella ochotensis]|nr:HV03 protein [Locustella ochotensis]
GLRAQLRLQEAGGGLRVAGDSVTLSCRESGFTVESHYVRWYRQAPGGSLQWVSLISSSGNVNMYAAAVEGRATASWDSYQSLSSLFLWALYPSHSARYFCAVHTG